MAKKGGLGKGLNALFLDNRSNSELDITMLKISEIEPNKNQPRKTFDENALASLADSISQHGVIQPLIVRPLASGNYQIVAGERRWRACKMLGMTETPVVIRQMDDKQVMEAALIENLQREDLNPIEEAEGYKELMDRFGLTQEEVAIRVGKSRPVITNALRLLTLPPEILDLVRAGRISAGQARAILSLDGIQGMMQTANEIVRKGMTVREIENRARRLKQSKEEGSSPNPKKAIVSSRDSFYDEMELALRDELHRKIKIDTSGEKGTIHIDFYNKQELIDIATRLSKK